MKFIQGKKAYLVSLATIVWALYGWHSGTIDATTAQEAILGAFGLAATRHAITTSTK